MQIGWTQRGAAALVSIALAGCANFSADGGLGAVGEIVQERSSKDIAWARSDDERRAIDARVEALLTTKPLGVEEAVQLALLNNRGLQAAFFELGSMEADVVQAGRLQNPRIAILHTERRASEGVRVLKIEQAITANIFALVTMPLALEVQRRRFYAAQRALALGVLAHASETRKAYYVAVGAEETVRYRQQVHRLASASAELARRMAQAGNYNRLQQAREQGFYADSAVALARAERARVAARERLARLLGVWGPQTQFELPERLPELPAAPQDLPDVEREALASRLDVQAARASTEAIAKNLGLTKVTRFLSVIELGPARVLEGERNDGWKRGYELGFEIPLFDWGSAKVAKAEAIYMQSVYRTAETSINARSEVRDAYNAYRVSYDVARHYRDEIVPIRKRIADENLLRYNGMLIGVFELLADARAQISSVNAYIETLRDYWLAQADLDMSKIGKPIATSVITASPAANDATPGH